MDGVSQSLKGSLEPQRLDTVPQVGSDPHYAANGLVMTVGSKGREVFIVDNSVSGWTGLQYWQVEPIAVTRDENKCQVIAELVEVMEG